MYVQSIEESNITKMTMDFKRGTFDEQNQSRFKKKGPNQDSSSAPKVNQERGGDSQFDKPSCSNCGTKNFGKCLASTNGCFECEKNDHKVRDCPTLAARGMEVKQASHSRLNLYD